MKYLIVNADDFGLSGYINEGIIKAHKAGSVTNTTLMIKRGSAGEAVALAKENPTLSVGLHLDLDGLLGKDERGSERFGLNRLSHMLSDPGFMSVVEGEIEAQIVAFKDTGLELTHLDGHHHLHAVPELFPLIVDKMVRYGIRTIRFSREFDLIKYAAIKWSDDFFHQMKVLLKKNNIRVADYFVTGWQPYDLKNIADGVTELMTHPGTEEEWRIKEFDILISKKWQNAVKESGIRLISFRDLAEMAVG